MRGPSTATSTTSSGTTTTVLLVVERVLSVTNYSWFQDYNVAKTEGEKRRERAATQNVRVCVYAIRVLLR